MVTPIRAATAADTPDSRQPIDGDGMPMDRRIAPVGTGALEVKIFDTEASKGVMLEAINSVRPPLYRDPYRGGYGTK